MRIAFDVDDTLWKVEPYESATKQARFRQIPDYDLIQVLRWFKNNGDVIFVWSAGGIDYAQQIADKLGLNSLVRVIAKGSEPMDIVFDDEETKMGKVDVRVNRIHF